MRKQRRGIHWIGALVLVALLCAGVFFIARSIVGGSTSQLRTAIQTPAQAVHKVEPLNDGIIYYDGAVLHALNGRAKQIWSATPGSSADFSVGTGGVASWSGSMLNIYSSDKGSSLFSGDVGGNILGARVGKVYCAVQVGEEHNSSILIMESSGRQIETIDLPNLTILDFGFFNADSLFWVMSLNTEGTVPVCTISTYRPGKMRLGDIEDSQQVLYEVVFQSSQIRAVGTNHIKEYDYTGKEITDNRMLVYGWYLMSMDEDAANPMMVFVPSDQSDGSSGINTVRMIRGQVEQSVRLPYGATRVLVEEDTIYAFSGQYVMVCRMGEKTPATYALPVYVDEVLEMAGNKNCLVTSGGMVYIIPLP